MKALEDFIDVQLWEKQRQLVDLVRNNRLVACKSGHSTGKTLASAFIAVDALINNSDMKIIVVNPVWRMAMKIFVPALDNIYNELLEKLPWLPEKELGSCNWNISPCNFIKAVSSELEDVLMGYEGKQIFFICEEPSSYPKEVTDTLELYSGFDNVKILLIGNPFAFPDNPYFGRCFIDGRFSKFTISSTDSPNVKKNKDGSYRDIDPLPYPGLIGATWLNHISKQYGKNSNFWRNRVLGEF